MNSKRTLRIVRQIIKEYDDGNIMQSMRNFVVTLKHIVVASGPECEEAIRQSLRILFADIDRSALNLIPDTHLDFLRGMQNEHLVGSGLKQTVMKIISEGSFTKVQFLQYFSNLLSDMTDLGERLRTIEQNMALIGINTEDIPPAKALITASLKIKNISGSEFQPDLSCLLEIIGTINNIAASENFSLDMQAEDYKDSSFSFMVDRSTATLFSLIYLGILDTYSYIGSFDSQINNFKSLTSSKNILSILEDEKKRMLGERLSVSTNMALTEFFKRKDISQELIEQSYAIILKLIQKIEAGFNFEIELNNQKDNLATSGENDDKLISYLFNINKLLSAPRKGLGQILFKEIENNNIENKHIEKEEELEKNSSSYTTKVQEAVLIH